MKTLKFAPHLCEEIVRGEKTSTWRLFDDKDLQVGDTLRFINKESGEAIGTATIIGLRIKTLGTLDDADWEGHERFPSEGAMYETFRSYYGEAVDADTEVKIVEFDYRR
jgi:hypothetical protein